MMVKGKFQPKATSRNIKLALIDLASLIAQRKAQFSEEQLDHLRKQYKFAYNYSDEKVFVRMVEYINCKHIEGFKLEIVRDFNNNGASIQVRRKVK